QPAGATGPEPEEEPAYVGRRLRQWIADLKDADAQVRHQAAYALARMGPNIRLAFPALKDAVKDSDPDGRRGAADTLGHCGPQALPVLLELLESEESRYPAITGLQHLDPDPLPELLRLLSKGEVRQRRVVAASMNYFRQRDGRVVSALQLALEDPD